MTGATPFHRAVRLSATTESAEAVLEDDFHRFSLRLRHDGRIVQRLEASAERYPWATCIEAADLLANLQGAAITAHPAALFRQADPRVHCTHLFELAALAIAQAARGAGERIYETSVSNPGGYERIARLRLDGALVLSWRLAGDAIIAPMEYAGRALSDFGSPRLAELEPQEAERLFMLRRAAWLANGRRTDVDAFANAAAMDRTAQCYSLQPANAPRALRMRGSIRRWPNRRALAAAIRTPPG